MQSSGLRLLALKSIGQLRADTNRSRYKIIAINIHRLYVSNKEQSTKGHNENLDENVYKPCQKVRVEVPMPSNVVKQQLEHNKSCKDKERTTLTSNDNDKATNIPKRSALPHTEASNSAWSTESPNHNENVVTPKAKSVLMQNQMMDVKGYMFTRFFDHVKNYDKLLEKNFPSAMKVYRVFFDGVKHFFSDMKNYLKISRIVHLSPNGLKALNRKEVELYMRMPRDMIKIAPTLIFTSLPMIGYAVFPIVFMYPRKFLTAHFWSDHQRAEFQELQLKERLSCNRDVFRILQANLKIVETHEKHEKLQYIFGLLGSGFHPTVECILDVQDIFAASPYRLESLSSKHLKLLAQMHGLRGGMFKKYRLTEHAFLVHHMDLAIRREGDVHNMLPTALRYSCFLRGLNANNLSNDEMIEWLRNWIAISTAIQSEHISLFLHLPLLLAYNSPSNWKLIYNTKLPEIIKS